MAAQATEMIRFIALVIMTVLAAGVLHAVTRQRDQQHQIDQQGRSIKFVHDLDILCAYDRHICLGGATTDSPLIRKLLVRAGLNPDNIGKERDR